MRGKGQVVRPGQTHQPSTENQPNTPRLPAGVFLPALKRCPGQDPATGRGDGFLHRAKIGCPRLYLVKGAGRFRSGAPGLLPASEERDRPQTVTEGTVSVPVDGREDTKDLDARNRLERKALSGMHGGRDRARGSRDPLRERTRRSPRTLSPDGSPRPTPCAPGSEALRPGVHPPASPEHSGPSHLLPPGAPTLCSQSPELRSLPASRRSQEKRQPRA